MRKLFTSVITAITVIAFAAAAAFAAGSSYGIVEIVSVKDSNGTDINYTVTDTSIPLLTREIASSLNGVPAEELTVLWQRDITADVLPATITYNVNGTDGRTLYSFHWTGSAWELMNSATGPSITTTYSSLSPVGIVVRVPAGATDGDTSPRTGDNTIMIASVVIVLAAASAAYVVATKKA